ncbi:hypothetical protein KY362_05935 [Candidatus Woesearchaeota archaeon]|nr:hypothetical protein [Candidatus Woesearchaeota archaeon]
MARYKLNPEFTYFDLQEPIKQTEGIVEQAIFTLGSDAHTPTLHIFLEDDPVCYSLTEPLFRLDAGERVRLFYDEHGWNREGFFISEDTHTLFGYQVLDEEGREKFMYCPPESNLEPTKSIDDKVEPEE